MMGYLRAILVSTEKCRSVCGGGGAKLCLTNSDTHIIEID